nr:immunoglobulin heavy chain junction region [Mus musculus]MBK4195159.1 immunoglobulin heavy chain junction region [Mus musculus]MBK4195160.1 immunoglobulin heavy chain junction region [Mus musculus]MBK4196503.1 immunoglobulin heavy chain junction region [Mus musculus]
CARRAYYSNYEGYFDVW